MASVAERIDRAVVGVTGSPCPLRVRAWDGSVRGPATGPTIVLRSDRAVRRIVWHPGEVGLADAYIGADLDVDGDLSTALRALRSVAGPGRRRRSRPLGWARLVMAAVRLGAIGPRLPLTGSPVAVTGRRHSRQRDRGVIAHHYDVPAAFYELLLDESMAYSCGYFASPNGGSLADAQRAKLDLICHKLGLNAGRTLLDIGCGWGALACHAARDFGARVTAVTLSAGQRDFVIRRVARAGLAGSVSVRLADYRDLTGDGGFDAIAAVEVGEHVGRAEYPRFAALLRSWLRPGGRAVVQQMSRSAGAPDGGGFIRTWIAPDMYMQPLADTVEMLAAAGLEIHDVHDLGGVQYARTIAGWSTNLERHWDRAVSLVGPEVARVWRLYLTGAGLSFATGNMGVAQVLAGRATPRPSGLGSGPSGSGHAGRPSSSVASARIGGA